MGINEIYELGAGLLAGIRQARPFEPFEAVEKEKDKHDSNRTGKD